MSDQKPFVEHQTLAPAARLVSRSRSPFLLPQGAADRRGGMHTTKESMCPVWGKAAVFFASKKLRKKARDPKYKKRYIFIVLIVGFTNSYD